MICNYNDYGVHLYIHLKAFTNSTTVKFLAEACFFAGQIKTREDWYYKDSTNLEVSSR